MRSRFVSALMLVGALALGACGDDGGKSPTGARKKISVYLTDAPFPYDSVARVDVHVVSIALTTISDTTSANTDWVTVATPDKTYNLLDLQDGTASRLAETQLT